MKLYEILLRKAGFGKKSGPLSEYDKIYNPIGCMIGSVIKVNFLDYIKFRFTVTEIRDYTVPLGDREYKMVDYVLQARAPGENSFFCRLRLVPDDDNASTLSHRAMIMNLYDDMPYNEELHNVVKDDTLQFVIDNDDPDQPEHLEFWRVNDVRMAFEAKVRILADENRDGKLDADEVTTATIDFWDYFRNSEVEGEPADEFLFVEMDKKDGWFSLWRGLEVEAFQVDVIEA